VVAVAEPVAEADATAFQRVELAYLAAAGPGPQPEMQVVDGPDGLIAYERGTIDRSALDEDDLAIAPVSVAEHRVGIEMADTVERAAERARALAVITSAVNVLDYTEPRRSIMAACWPMPGVRAQHVVRMT
jgi:hypothetical protein